MSRLPAWSVMGGLLALAIAGCASQSVGPRDGQVPASAGLSPDKAEASKVVVYYMHRTFRCISCLTIEHMTRKTLKEDFASELASGRLELRVADFWIQQDLAKQYGVTTVSIVVVNLDGDREVSHQTLEKVWDLKGKPDEFRAYLAKAVKAALAKAEQPGGK